MKTMVESLVYGENKNILFKDFFYVPEDDQERKFGEIYAFLQIESDSLDKQALSMTVLDTLKEVFYRSMNLETPENAFEKTIKELNTLIKSLYKKRKDNWQCKISGVIAVRSGNSLFLSQTGTAASYLHRSSFLADIIQEEGGNNDFEEIFKNIASGDLVQGDKIIFSSNPLVKYISSEEITNVFNFNETKKVGDVLQPKIKLTDNELLGVLIIDLQKVAAKQESSIVAAQLKERNQVRTVSRLNQDSKKNNLSGFDFSKVIEFFQNVFHKTKKGTKNMTGKVGGKIAQGNYSLD